MPVHRLDHVNLRAAGSGFAALREFYCQVLGLRVGERPPLASVGLWLYAGADPIVHLVEVAQGAPSAAERAAPGLAFDHVAFACSGLEEMLRRLDDRGVPKTVQANPVTGQVLVRLEDPSGLCVELVFPAERAGG
jgi:glyoxylase I family protein